MNEDQRQCLECYKQAKKGNPDYDRCAKYRDLRRQDLTEKECVYITAIKNDIEKARKGIKALTFPMILEELARQGVEDLPRAS